MTCDCVSLPNAAELVEELRNFAMFYAEATKTDEKKDMDFRAADAIDQLVSKCNQLTTENRQLKAERDAAVAEIPKHCGTCRRFFKHEPCLDNADSCGWEWRGVKEEEK